MEKITFLSAGNQFVIIDNITFLEQKDITSTIIHFTGGKSLQVNINFASLKQLIETEIKKV